ncbi:MAG: permease-like cell division protein FtsX [bacterium]|nr:permease-like cell division protein FtsX [bacterium]
MKTLQRLFSTTFKRITRNPYNAAGAIAVMFLTFLVGGSFVLISFGSNKILSYYESRPQVIAFLKDDTTDTQVEEIKESLNSTGKVSSVNYVSKEAALEIYKSRNKSQPELTEFVTADILPSSLEISTKNIEDQDEVAKAVAAEPQVEEVAFLKELIDNLTKWTKAIRLVGMSSIVFLMLTSIFVTLVVIGLNISLHKEEIEIMKLVGATERYIRTPFLFEGALYGLVSALLSTLATIGAMVWLSPFVSRYLGEFSLVPVPWTNYAYLLAAEAGVGIFVGTLGSYIATRKYLKV